MCVYITHVLYVYNVYVSLRTIKPREQAGVASRPPLWVDRAMQANQAAKVGRGDDTVGNPHRAQIYRFELFELILLLKLDKQLPVQRFEATLSQSTVPSPPLKRACVNSFQTTLTPNREPRQV